jgi:hypothetical protein
MARYCIDFLFLVKNVNSVEDCVEILGFLDGGYVA